MNWTGTVVVIPTRNRADLARNAITSVLNQPECEVDILVSDNSTSATERAELSSYCEQAADRRLRYIVPPEPLPMTQHWDWVMEQAFSLYDGSHITFLTDRMMFKPGAWKPLADIITAYPNQVVSYMHDMVDDFSSPVVVHQYTWTDNLYEVRSTRLLELSSHSIMYDSSVPRMLNCLVPRTVLTEIKRHFGNFFDSISPDWDFAYRVLALEDSILFHDKAALVHYAQRRSNGQSTHYGIVNEAQAQFINDLKGAQPNAAAPFPEIRTVWNGIISEYCHIKKITQSRKFPGLNFAAYKEALAVGVAAIRDPKRQAEMRELLAARGCKAPEIPSAPLSSESAPIVADVLGEEVQHFCVNTHEFQSATEALDYALNHAREKARLSDHETLIYGVRRASPQELAAVPADSNQSFFGINLIAYIRAEMGLGTAARGLAHAFEAANIPFNIINFEHSNPSLHRDDSWKKKEVTFSSYDFTVLAVNPDNIFNAKQRAKDRFVTDRYTIGCWSWELPIMPDTWLSAFPLVDEVWVPSRFVQDSMAGKSPVPVFRVPHAIHVGLTDRVSRASLSLPERQFLFLWMGDMHSEITRKNPLGVIRAFKMAFPKESDRAGLVLKVNNADSIHADHGTMALIKQQIAGHRNIYLLDRGMIRNEIDALLAASDCFISLHRAEGFGLGAAEAMSLGKPVILTNWSGNTDYMTRDNSIAIGYQLVPLGKRYGPYPPDQLWAEPNVEEAASAMKELVEDPELACRIGRRGQETIERDFSPQAVGRVISERLTCLRNIGFPARVTSGDRMVKRPGPR